MEAAAVVSMLAVLALFRFDLTPGAGGLDVALQTPELVVLEDIQQTRQIEKPPPPPRPPAPVEVPDDEVLEEESIDIDATIDFAEFAELPPPPPPPQPVQEEEEEREFFIVVEEPPVLIGGLASLNGVLEYPEVARQAGIAGTVYVRIIVDKEGNPTQPEVLRGVNKLLDKAAMEAVMKLKFVPGKQRGRPVAVQMAFPVRFVLNT